MRRHRSSPRRFGLDATEATSTDNLFRLLGPPASLPKLFCRPWMQVERGAPPLQPEGGPSAEAEHFANREPTLSTTSDLDELVMQLN